MLYTVKIFDMAENGCQYYKFMIHTMDLSH